MKKYYKILAGFTGFIFFFLIFCTVISRVIETSNLKTVVTQTPIRTDLTVSVNATAVVCYDDVFSYSYELPLKVANVFVEVNQNVKKGEILAEVDISEYNIDLKRKELNVLQIQNQIKSIGSTKELELQLEIAELELGLFKNKFPENGIIYAKRDEIITAVNIDENVIIGLGDTLIETIEINSKPCLKFILPDNYSDKFSEDDTVIQYITETIFNNGVREIAQLTKSVKIEKITFDFILNQNIFYCPVASEKIYPGQIIQIKIVRNSPVYDMVVPLSAIKESGEKHSVFVLKERDGLFGKEYYIQSETIDILKSNDYNAAIESVNISPFDLIVTESSDYLLSGEIVKINDVD